MDLGMVKGPVGWILLVLVMYGPPILVALVLGKLMRLVRAGRRLRIAWSLIFAAGVIGYVLWVFMMATAPEAPKMPIVPIPTRTPIST